MAADQAAAVVGTYTLTADTNASIQITTPTRKIELVNHGTDVVYFATAGTEAGLPTLAGGGADDEAPLLGGERLMQDVGSGETWVTIRSAGTPTVSVVAIPTHG